MWPPRACGHDIQERIPNETVFVVDHSKFSRREILSFTGTRGTQVLYTLVEVTG